jgi:Chaperone of endosialidase
VGGGDVQTDNTIRIGDSTIQTTAFIAGIYNVNEGGAILPVYINNIGHLGTMSSSRRFKDEIKPMDQSSKAILALKPVTFRYKKGIDPDSCHVIAPSDCAGGLRLDGAEVEKRTWVRGEAAGRNFGAKNKCVK